MPVIKRFGPNSSNYNPFDPQSPEPSEPNSTKVVGNRCVPIAHPVALVPPAPKTPTGFGAILFLSRSMVKSTREELEGMFFNRGGVRLGVRSAFVNDP